MSCCGSLEMKRGRSIAAPPHFRCRHRARMHQRMNPPRRFMPAFIGGAWFIDCRKLVLAVTLLIRFGVVLSCGRFTCTGLTGLLVGLTMPVLPVRIGWVWPLAAGTLVFRSIVLTPTCAPTLPTLVTGSVAILPVLPLLLPAFAVVVPAGRVTT